MSPYAFSKKTDEYLAKLYYDLYGLKTIGLRYFNVFGRKQNPYSEYSAVIPKFIKAILKGEEITINGNGEQSRDFTYIDNVIEANLKACISDEDAAGQVFNVAFGQNTSINELYKLISIFLDKKTKVNYGPERKGDIKNSLADIEKTKKILKYNPKYSIKDGLEKTVEWYIKNLNLKIASAKNTMANANEIGVMKTDIGIILNVPSTLTTIGMLIPAIINKDCFEKKPEVFPEAFII